MKILIVSSDFPPIMSPRAYRWGAVAEEFVRAGHEVDVVCACKPGISQTEYCGATVHRVGARLLETLRVKWGGGSPIADGGARRPRALDGHDRTTLPSRLMAAAYYGLWKPLYWPDSQCLFIGPALRTARRLLRRQHYDAIMTVSLPFSSHVVGLRLKRQFPSLPWLVDIGDPFALLYETPLNNHRLYGRLNHRVEARVLKQADAIAVTTGGARDQYADTFRLAVERFAVIPPLLSLPPTPTIRTTAAQAPAGGDRIRMVYCGQLYRSIRNPQHLLELLRYLVETRLMNKRLELHLFGGQGDCGDLIEAHRSLVGKHLFLHGQVDRRVVVTAMQDTDVLVNIGNSTSHQVPSKIIEYIAQGKPIINLVSHSADCTLELLASHPAVLTLRIGADGLVQSAGQTARFLESLPPRIGHDQLEKLRAPFLPTTIAAQYLDLLNPAKGSSRRRIVDPAGSAVANCHLPLRPVQTVSEEFPPAKSA